MTEWKIRIPDKYPAYIDWATFERIPVVAPPLDWAIHVGRIEIKEYFRAQGGKIAEEIGQ